MFQDLKPYPEYKDADLPWLETLPSHWAAARGKTLFTRMERQVREEDGVVTCFRDGRVMLRSRRRTTGFTESLKEIGYQGIRQGDLVIHAMDAFAGAVGVAEDDGKSTPVYAACVPRGDASTRYYAHLVRRLALSGWIQANARGVRERSTDYRWASFAEERLPVPPREEQEAIVTYLAHAHQRINKAIATKRRLIALLTEYGSLVTQEILAGREGCAASALVDSRSEQLGLVPEDWRLVTVGAIVRGIQTGPFGSQLHAHEYVAGGVPVVNPKHIVGGRILPEDAVTITEARAKSLARHRLRAGDVIAARRGELGRSAVVQPDDEGAVCGTGSVVIRVDESQVTPEYFQRVFSSPQTRGQLEEASRGATMPNLNEGMIARVRVALPPRELQKSVLSAVDEEVSKQGKRIAAVSREIELLEEFRTRLTADVVTGQVDVRSIAATLPPIELADVFDAAAGAVDADDDEMANEAGMEDE